MNREIFKTNFINCFFLPDSSFIEHFKRSQLQGAATPTSRTPVSLTLVMPLAARARFKHRRRSSEGRFYLHFCRLSLQDVRGDMEFIFMVKTGDSMI